MPPTSSCGRTSRRRLLVQNRDRSPFGYVWEDDVARAVKEGSDVLPLSTIHEMPVVATRLPSTSCSPTPHSTRPPSSSSMTTDGVSGVIPRVTLLAAISEQNQEAGEASETTEAEGADA